MAASLNHTLTHTMHVTILDDHQDCVRHLSCFDKLAAHEVTILNHHIEDPQELAACLRHSQAIVPIRERTRLDRALLSQLPALELIAQTGAVGRHLDVQACQELGIQVTQSQGSGSATAEMTLLLILAGLRHLVAEVQHMKQGLWQRTLGRQLRGRRLGILGLGRIGTQVGLAAQALGAHVWAWGREGSREVARQQAWPFAPSREAFFAQSDIVCIMLRLNEDTRSWVTAQDLALMKPDALLVNTARAELIEPGALWQALKQGRPGQAAIDVYESEPVLDPQHPLLQLPNCLCTPHLGFVEQDNYEAYFGQAFDAINAHAARR
jgi:D-3-phosphoglycerate dehydrogenase